MNASKELKPRPLLTPYTIRYGRFSGSVVFPFRAEYERDLIMQMYAKRGAA